MRLKKAAEACMWLPGFGPGEDPFASPVVLSTAPSLKLVSSRSYTAPWLKLTEDLYEDLKSREAKADANLAAIQLLQQLETVSADPTEDQQKTLARFTGWGAMPQIFSESQEWSDRAETLKRLLSSDEYEVARAATLNSHFTPLSVVKAMWQMLERLGFKGGKILEPSVGSGRFIGSMPSHLAQNSRITAVELDEMTARMFGKLYPTIKLRKGAFENQKFLNDHFDLVVGNVPFGNYKVNEKRSVPYREFLIHDYFIARSLDLVRPGGLVCLLSSSGTMEKSDTKVRSYLAGKAELVAAVRLPHNVFVDSANTEVVSDLLILQKLSEEEMPTKKWVGAYHKAPMSICKHYHGNVWVNEFFVNYPDFVIGKLYTREIFRQGQKLFCEFDGDFETALQGVISLLPESVYEATPDAAEEEEVELVTQFIAPANIKPYSLQLHEGEIHRWDGNQLYLCAEELPKGSKEKTCALLEIRDAVIKLIEVQLNTDSDDLVKHHQINLTSLYDNFVQKFGFISEAKNKKCFHGDPDLPLLLSLEVYDEDTDAFKKAAIFFVRTINPYLRPSHAETEEEALLISLSEYGRINFPYMATLLGSNADNVKEALCTKNLVFDDPVSGQWQIADAYLSGNVRKKLAEAEYFAESNPKFSRHVEALTQVQPVDLKPSEISANLGSSWISEEDYGQFFNHLLDEERCSATYLMEAGSWECSFPYGAERSAKSTSTWGTSRMPLPKLMDHIMNQKTITIFDEDVDGKKTVNRKQTELARMKESELKQEFRQWLFDDDERRERLCRKYNDEMNNIRPRVFNGSHLQLPGMSNVFKLRTHQMNAIWRIVSGGNTLVAHAVGAGKTAVACCSAMELRRLRLAAKPLIVVPNHMLEDFGAEFLRLYPTANLLLASKDDLHGERRKVMLNRIATGNWDAVIITHSSFERIPLSATYMKQFVDKTVWELEQAARAVSLNASQQTRLVKQLESMKKRWRVRMEKMADASARDDTLTFDQLGVDFLFVDEAHYFKNLIRFSKMTRIAGLPNSDANRAFDMLLKVRLINQMQNKERGVVFMTGTPVSNTIAELFVMQQYLQENTLAEYGIKMFDSWAANFGERVTSLEIAPDGSGYRLNTRFSRFINLPELMNIFAEVADIKTKEDLNLPTPRLRHGKPSTIVSPCSPELKNIVASLVERAEAIRDGKVSPSEDNMLAITGEGRKAALSLRLIDPSYPDHPDNKVNQCVDNVFDIWLRGAQKKLTQLVFCDLSTPKTDGAYDVYNDIAAKLKTRGIPDAEIEFIHDHDTDLKKAKLFAKVRAGKVRVLFGSTAKLGVGTNVQTLLCAMHELDAPWRPSDVEQRLGRIERQGNENAEIEVYRYVTEASFDAYIWQLLQAKAVFIAQVMSGDKGLRTVEDAEVSALSYAEIKALASGNPLVLEKAQVDSEVARLSLLRNAHQDSLYLTRQKLLTYPAALDASKGQYQKVMNDIEALRHAMPTQVVLQYRGQKVRDKEMAESLITMEFKTAYRASKHNQGTIEWLGSFAGMKLGLKTYSGAVGMPTWLVEREGRYPLPVNKHGNVIVANLMNLPELLQSFLSNITETIVRYEKDIPTLKEEANKPFAYEEQLTAALQRQLEINTMLDLDKDQVQAGLEEFAEAA